MESTTMTIHLPRDVKDKLDRLAAETDRDVSSLVTHAVAGYVTYELRIIDGIKRGLADVEAGRVVPHDEAMAEVERIIDGAERKRAQRS